MYEQLLIHLVADYWLQNDWMALNKKRFITPAIIHALIYTIPFVLLTQSPWALMTIGITHLIIDSTTLVTHLNQIKNWNFSISYKAANQPYNYADGFSPERPIWIRIWLIIIQDNILHLVINYLAIKYL